MAKSFGIDKKRAHTMGRPQTQGGQARSNMAHYNAPMFKNIKPMTKQDKEMNSLVRKYLESCDQGQKLNIKAYLLDVCSTNKSFFYPEDSSDFETRRKASGSHKRRNSVTSLNSQVGEITQDGRRSSMRQESVTGSATSPQLSKKQTKKMLLKQQMQEEKLKKQEEDRLEKEAMKKAWHLVDHYQAKQYSPEKFMRYRDQRNRELELQFIKEYAKKGQGQKSNVRIMGQMPAADDETTTSDLPDDEKDFQESCDSQTESPNRESIL